jgi:outer membrane immunogenic protein
MNPVLRIVGTAALVLCGGAASAADYPMATTSEFVNWTGAYFGGFGGYAAGEITADADTAGYDSDYDLNFALGGAEFGYNHQFGRFVVGGEIDISFTDGDTSETVGVLGEYQSNIDWLATFRLRAGYTWDNLLVYATGGFAAAETDDRFIDPLGVREETTGSRKGWTVGGGLEWAFYDNWSVKGEYLFVDLGDDEAIEDVNGVLGFGESTVEHKYHVGKVGINYHF